MLVIIFGLQGAGKTYVGKVLKSLTGYEFYDGDTDLPDSMKQALISRKPITLQMRKEFFDNIFLSIENKLSANKTLIVAQTFVKDKFRKEALLRFPNAKFILVKAKPKLRRQRLLQRDHLNLSSDYEKRMAARFDTPTIPHEVLQNNQEGRKHIEEQLNILMKKLSL